MKRTKKTKLCENPANEPEENDASDKFNCPADIIRTCPETDKLPKELIDFGERYKFDEYYSIQKLGELVTDPVTNDNTYRICRLLCDYLRERVKDLPAVMKTLEFLAWNASSIDDYEIYLDRMLDLCNFPPLLESTTESLCSVRTMERYFTQLGYLLVVLPNKHQFLKILEALQTLLTKRDSADVHEVKLEYCRKVAENSELPTIAAELLEAALPDMFPIILELVFLLASTSCACCHKMLKTGVLNTLLIRIDLPYATQMHCTRPPEMVLEGREYPEETTFLIINTLWSLMNSILPPRQIPDDLKNNLRPVQCAMWGLRYAFKRQIRYGQHRSNNVQMRNKIAMFILAGLVAIPSWNLLGSGIADDVITLLVGIVSDSAFVLSERIKFGGSNDDLFLLKVLLLTVTHLAEVDACISLMIKRKLMGSVLQLVNPNMEDFKMTWSTSQFWDLWKYALAALNVLAPKLPKEFLRDKGTIRLSMILEWSSSEKFDEQVVLNCTKAISTIVLNDRSFLTEKFREHGTTCSVIKLVNYILDTKRMTLQQQRILTLLLFLLERLVKNLPFYHEMYGEQSIRFVMKLLFQCLYQKDSDFQVDQRLLLATGSYIWECIVWCPSNLRKFIEHGAVYVILDIIEIVSYPVRCLFLGILTDICDNTFCGPYLCTWRGIDKKTGLMSLLAKAWRDEELRIGKKNRADDSVEAEESSEMGSKQWTETYREKLRKDISPAIIDTIGSVRSKVYSIRRIIERDNERFDIARRRYRILLNDISMEDRITISRVDMYFRLKLGQVWTEIEKYLEQVNVTPLAMDGQVIFLLTQRYESWGPTLRNRREKIIESEKREEEIKEIDEYAKIRESKLAVALDAFDELDYIRRTTDRAYMLTRKAKQTGEVNSYLRFPPGTNAEHCHRTFQENVNVTAIFNQRLLINSASASGSNFGQTRVPSVSQSFSRD